MMLTDNALLIGKLSSLEIRILALEMWPAEAPVLERREFPSGALPPAGLGLGAGVFGVFPGHPSPTRKAGPGLGPRPEGARLRL